MAQFALSWNNTALLDNINNVGQRVSYRQKSLAGTWLTAGFTPPNDMVKTVNSAVTPILTSNIVWQFKIEALCSQNGPVINQGGTFDQIQFVCIPPDIVNSDTTSAIGVNLAGTDITKVRFTLRKSSDNSIVFGPITADRVSGMASVVADGLTATTNYYWQTILFANVNGIEANSGLGMYLDAPCGPFETTTDAAPIANYEWIAGAKACEKEGGLTLLKTISGLSSPHKTWFDEDSNRVYVADLDDPNGNVYWFNPDTAINSASMTHTNKIMGTFYSTEFDPIHKRIFFVGLTGTDNDGLVVYDIESDTRGKVAFGTSGAFSRTLLFMTDTKIYCNDAGEGKIYIIDRATLAVTSTVLISSLTIPAHFNSGPFTMVQANNGNIYVVSNNATVATVGVYSPTLAHIAEITLPSATTWVSGHYWQNIFYDKIGNRVYVSDTGANRRYIIDPTTNTVLTYDLIGNLQGKTNVSVNWTLNPLTNELYRLHTLANYPADPNPIKRTYIQSRENFDDSLVMFEDKYFGNMALILNTTKVMSTDIGQPIWSGNVGWATDGSVTIMSNSAGSVNTGRQLVLSLVEVNTSNGNLPTGNTKPNVPTDPDYISPVINATSCPLVYSTACPTDLVTTFSGTKLEYEFSIPEAVKSNPNIAKIVIYPYNTNTASIESPPVTINAPFSNNYFDGSFTGLGGLNYDIKIKYIDSLGLELQTC